MQRERFHLVLGARVETIEVDHVAPGARAIGGAGIVSRGGLTRRLEIGERFHAVRVARQHGEEARQLAVGALGYVTIAGEELLRLGVIEARVGAQHRQELGERPGEAGLPDDGVHGRADARDLRQPDPVDRVGGQRRGGVLLDRVGVVLLPVGERLGGDRTGARREIPVHHEGAECDERGVHALRDERARRRRQAVARGGGDGLGKAREWAIEWTLRHVVAELTADLIGNGAEGAVGLHPSPVDAAPKQCGELLEVSGVGLEAAEVRTVVGHRPKGRDRRQLRDAELRAVELVQHHHLGRKALSVHGDVEVPAKELEREQILSRELRRIDGAGALAKAADVALAPLDRGGGEVGEAIVVAWVAEPGRPLRVLAEPPLPVVLGQRGEGARGRVGGHRALLGRGVRRQREEREGGEREGARDGVGVGEATTHC